jgi:hypothetical protein
MEEITKEEQLKAIIEKAYKNDLPLTPEMPKSITPVEYSWIIFSHDFLKAYFGEEQSRYIATTDNMNIVRRTDQSFKLWQYHAQQLVLSDNRIEYLYQFIND